MRLDISPLHAGQDSEACGLFLSVFGHAVSPAQWHWKYRLGPRLGSINMLARDGAGELVGHVGASVFPGAAQGRSLPMAQICDIMVNRHARGGLGAQNVYPQLVRAVQRALREQFPGVFAYGFPGLRPFKLGERLGFYRQIYRCEATRLTHDRWLDPHTLLWSAAEIGWDIPRLERLWQRHCNHDRTPAVARTGAYLCWRYRDHPVHAYRIWILRRLFQDAGWMVTRAMPDGETCMVDALLLSPFQADAASAALGRALAKVDGTPSVINHWLRSCRHPAQPTPIVATEFKVTHWHDQGPQPHFLPGDTDVF